MRSFFNWKEFSVGLKRPDLFEGVLRQRDDRRRPDEVPVEPQVRRRLERRRDLHHRRDQQLLARSVASPDSFTFVLFNPACCSEMGLLDSSLQVPKNYSVRSPPGPIVATVTSLTEEELMSSTWNHKWRCSRLQVARPWPSRWSSRRARSAPRASPILTASRQGLKVTSQA